MSLSSNVMLVIILFAIFFLFALYFGKDKIVSLIISFYPAAFLVSNFPYFSTFIAPKATAFQIVVIKSAIFAVFFAASFYFIQKHLMLHFPYSKVSRMIQAAILSILAVALSHVFMRTVVPFTGVYKFTGSIAYIISTKEFIFWWLLAPIVSLLVLTRGE